jgi:hypothetical protein
MSCLVCSRVETCALATTETSCFNNTIRIFVFKMSDQRCENLLCCLISEHTCSAYSHRAAAPSSLLTLPHFTLSCHAVIAPFCLASLPFFPDYAYFNTGAIGRLGASRFTGTQAKPGESIRLKFPGVFSISPHAVTREPAGSVQQYAPHRPARACVFYAVLAILAIATMAP